MQYPKDQGGICPQ